MEQKILIIEDDKEICGMIGKYLNKNGYDILEINDGIKGLDAIRKYSPDLVILDIMLPYKSGDEVLKELREFSHVPVIVVSAKDMVQTKVDILKSGADDYITKPFALVELLARIEVVLKRYTNEKLVDKPISYREINLNSCTMEVRVNKDLITLTSKEFNILKIMMKNPSKVFSKQNLYESVWNEAYAYDDDTINTHISNLRKKLKENGNIDYIETVWGMGYKLR